MGFRTGNSGVHNSRTIMLDELRQVMDLLRIVPEEELPAAVVVENALGKKTAATRAIALQKLKSLYGLSSSIPMFRVFRELWQANGEGRQLLAALVAQARDPQLASTWDLVRRSEVGLPLGSDDFESDLLARYGKAFQPSTIASASRNVSSSWSQAGFLGGGKPKVRTVPQASPEVLVLALWFGTVQGYRDQRLLESPWIDRLGVSRGDVEVLLQLARQRGYIDYRNAGGIVEIRLDRWFTREERAHIDVTH